MARRRDEALDRLGGGARQDRSSPGRRRTSLSSSRSARRKDFRAGRFDTGFIDRNLAALGAARAADGRRRGRCRGALSRRSARRSAWRCGAAAERRHRRTVVAPTTASSSSAAAGRGCRRRRGASRRPCDLAWDADGASSPRSRRAGEDLTVVEAGDEVIVLRDGRQTRVALHDPFAVDLEHMDEGGVVKAPMHGKLVAVFVQPGDRVEKGQRLAVVEAMKMEHALVAPADGEVAEVAAEPGEQVAEGARLIVLKTDG